MKLSAETFGAKASFVVKLIASVDAWTYKPSLVVACVLVTCEVGIAFWGELFPNQTELVRL